MKKQILLISAVVASLILSGCGNSSDDTASSSNGSITSNNTLSAQLDDSPISNLAYITQSYYGVTDSNGYFKYSKNDKNVTFHIGDLIIGTFDLSKLNKDKKILPADLLGIDRNDTYNSNLLNMLQFLQTLDEDHNVSNGIQVDGIMKINIKRYFTFHPDTYNKDLLKNSLSDIQDILKIGSDEVTLVDRWKARLHYLTTLNTIGVKLKNTPFIMTCDVDSGDVVPININPDYKGDYNFTIDWGDGTIDKNIDNNISHTYADAGDYNISISGDFPSAQFVSDDHILKIIQWGSIKWKSFHYAFNNVSNLRMSDIDTPDLSDVTDMSYAFYDSNLHTSVYTSIPDSFNDWNMSNITNMSYMFYLGSPIQDISNWDTHNVKDMNHMFAYSGIKQNINDWNVSNVTDMSYMFAHARYFNQPLDKWDTHNVKDMNHMFYLSVLFNGNINDWNISNVTNITYMFSLASSFNQNINNWNVSHITDMNYMFFNAVSFNQPLDKWDVSNVTDMNHMFTGATSFNQNINDWNVSNVTNMNSMFSGATAFNNHLYNWNVSKVTDMSAMLSGTSFNGDISEWNTSNVTDMSYLFYGTTAFSYQDLSGWNVSKVENYKDFNISTGSGNIWPNFN